MSIPNSANNKKEITILRPCLKFLQLHFLWPKTREELSPGIGYTIKAFIGIAFPYILVITSVAHIAYVKNNNFDVNLDEDVVVILCAVTLSLLSVEFYLKQEQYANVLLQLCDYKFGKPKYLEKVETLLSFLSDGFYYFVVLNVTIYGLVPVIERSRCEEYFKTKKIEELCGYFIPTPPSLIPKIDLIILKPLIIAIQIVGAFGALLPPAMVALLAFEMNVHLVVHIKYLKDQLMNLSKAGDVKKELHNLVKYHQHIIEIMDSMNSCCSRALCIHTFLTSSIIGYILNQIRNLTWATPAGPAMHLSCWIFALFLNSLGGEIILNESAEIGTALYFSDWMEFDQSLKKDVWLIICRTQKPLLLITGTFGYMSLGVFFTVMKGIYTLIAFPTK